MPISMAVFHVKYWLGYNLYGVMLIVLSLQSITSL